MLRTALIPLVLAVPVLMALACRRYVRRRREAGEALGEPRLVERIAGDLHSVPWRRLVAMLIAAMLLGLALGDPRWGVDRSAPPGGARDVVLVLDASNSMRVEDVSPNRLEQQRLVAQRLLASMPDDRVGVVAFAGQASVLAPPTRDHAAVRMFIDAVDPAIAPQTGSALGAGLRQAASLLAASPARPGARIVVLLSDGEVVGPDAAAEASLDAARQAATLGIVVHTVGIGSHAGGPVPDIDPRTGQRHDYKLDPLTGRLAVSALDEATLREVAALTDGSHRHLVDVGALDDLIGAIRGSPHEAGDGTGRDAAPRYPWFVFAALLLIAGDAVAERRRQASARRLPDEARAGVRFRDAGSRIRTETRRS